MITLEHLITGQMNFKHHHSMMSGGGGGGGRGRVINVECPEGVEWELVLPIWGLAKWNLGHWDWESQTNNYKCET